MRAIPGLTPLCVALCLASLGCSGGDSTADSQDHSSASPDPASAAPAGIPARNPELAPQGEELFTARACVSCHTIGGGRLVGPDLHGVTERRSREWILAMMLNPDSMLRVDTTARRLLGEYFTPMVDQGLSPNDAAALYEYLLAAGEAGQDAGGGN